MTPKTTVMTTTTIIPSYSLPCYQLSYVVFFILFFSFYINCILIRLYTMTPRATALTVSTTTTMLSTVMATRMTMAQQLQITQ